MSMIEELQFKLNHNSARLLTIPNDTQNQRIRKRIFQAIGKLKKEILAHPNNKSSSESSLCHNDNSSNDRVQLELLPPRLKLDKSGKSGRKKAKAKLRIINTELKELAQTKQLVLARKKFRSLLKLGLTPDVYSFTNMINAYIRCEDIENAKTSFNTMIINKIIPNVITLTTLLKGYCEFGDMKSANLVLYKSFQEFKLRPSIRTLSTFLRGCLRLGSVQSGYECYNQFAKQKKYVDTNLNDEYDDEEPSLHEDGVTDDVSARQPMSAFYDYLITLLSQDLEIEKCENILKLLLKVDSLNSILDNEEISLIEDINVGTYYSMSRGYAMLGDYSMSKAWTSATLTLIDSSNPLKQSIESKSRQSSSSSIPLSQSLKLFQFHRNEDLKLELQEILKYISMFECSEVSNNSNSNLLSFFLEHSMINLNLDFVEQANEVVKVYVDTILCKFRQLVTSLDSMSRVLYFGKNGECDLNSSVLVSTDLNTGTGTIEATDEGIQGKLILALIEKFGFNNVAVSTGSDISISSLDEKDRKAMEVLKTDLNKIISVIRKTIVIKIINSISFENNEISFHQLISPLTWNFRQKRVSCEYSQKYVNFVDDEKISSELQQFDELPVKLEICSGSGEWIVAQANNDILDRGTSSFKAVWVALELRCDRVHNILTKSIFHTFDEPIATEASTSHLEEDENSKTTWSLPSLLKFGGTPNLCILGGDASAIIPKHFPKDKVSEIHINYPEPPERTGGIKDSQGKHLLTQSFFDNLLVTLKDHGTITLLTDNFSYAESLANMIASNSNNCIRDYQSNVVNEFQSSSCNFIFVSKRLENDNMKVLHQSFPFLELGGAGAGKNAAIPGIDLMRGEPGFEAGHHVQTSSYFDRLWKNGKSNNRWFLFIEKVNVSEVI